MHSKKQTKYNISYDYNVPVKIAVATHMNRAGAVCWANCWTAISDENQLDPKVTVRAAMPPMPTDTHPASVRMDCRVLRSILLVLVLVLLRLSLSSFNGKRAGN